MLVRFVVSNYLSFGAETEFNMLTGAPRRLKEHVYKYGDLELLKTAAIYGPNGAGKSNLVHAMRFLQEFILSGNKKTLIDIQTFRLDQSFSGKPTSFEIEFVDNGVSYAFGISIFHQTIVEEWLYQTNEGKEDLLIFNRKTDERGKTTIEVNNKYYQTDEDKLRVKLYEDELLKDNQPLIKALAEAKQVFKEVRAAYSWFEHNLIIIYPKSKPIGLVANYSKSEKFKVFTNELLCSLQTGISKIDLEVTNLEQYFGEDDKEKVESIRKIFKDKKGFLQIPSKTNDAIAIWEGDQLVIKKLITKHSNQNGVLFDFTLEEESDGTQRILDFIPALYEAISHPVTVLIDEVDQSLHPSLIKDLLAKFARDKETKGQVIITTHESNLLDQEIFRQDEIWFAEKKASGETTFYPLSDFEIRYDLDIRKGYLSGRFGAIPFLGNLKDLNWEQYAEEEQGV